MNTRQRLSIAGLLVALGALASVLAWPDLPDRIATHWNAAGEPDGSLSKPLGLALLPAVTAVVVALLALVPRIDPLRENVAEFRAEFDWFVVVFAAFMTLVHGGIVAFNLGYDFDFLLLVLAGMVGLLYYAGYLLDHAERNWFVGIRTPWTLSSERVWDRTHDLGARLFKLAALVSLGGFLLPDLAFGFLVGPVLAVAVVTVAYSYVVYTRLEREAEVTPTEID